jgi:hypothetical protein
VWCTVMVVNVMVLFRVTTGIGTSDRGEGRPKLNANYARACQPHYPVLLTDNLKIPFQCTYQFLFG